MHSSGSGGTIAYVHQLERMHVEDDEDDEDDQDESKQMKDKICTVFLKQFIINLFVYF